MAYFSAVMFFVIFVFTLMCAVGSFLLIGAKMRIR